MWESFFNSNDFSKKKKSKEQKKKEATFLKNRKNRKK